MTLARGQAFAKAIIQVLGKHCRKIEVAGSIRRERPEVNDVDIVLLTDWPSRVIDRVKQTCTLKTQGQQNVTAIMQDGTQLDLWFTKPDGDDWFVPRPSNWGSVLLCRTGSVAHNAALCAYAQTKGLHFDAYRGLMRGEKVIASKTEEEIYAALGVPFHPPTEREAFNPQLRGDIAPRLQQPHSTGNVFRDTMANNRGIRTNS